MRARYPDQEGYVERDGVKVYYEVYGEGEPTVLLLPSSPIVHSRQWKAQIPYLSRHFRVIAFDGRGNGRSDRPTTAEAYSDREIVADAVAVMDATGTEQAVVVSLCHAWEAFPLAATHPERVAGMVAIAPGIPNLTPVHPNRAAYAGRFDEVLHTEEGWAKSNRHYWLRDWPGFVEFFFGQCLPEPHSTKQLEDIVGWALETTPEAMLLAHDAPLSVESKEEAEELCRQVRCPVLVIHGTEDSCQHVSRGEAVARLTGGGLVVLEGSGHIAPARDPVKVNLLIKDFVQLLGPPAASPSPTLAQRGREKAAFPTLPQRGREKAASPTLPLRGRENGAGREIRWTRGRARRQRALYLSSPIGLGHAQRDVAIAEELRKLHPDLEIDWLAQHPVTQVLESRRERIHPASALLANESAHWTSESGEHDLHCFQALRRMDEILLANFMVFHEVVEAEAYDLVVGDEAWDVDYFWHENPELKRTAFAWMTDFVGFLPMPDGGDREAFLTADYNTEMIEQVARYPRLRDRSIFVGSPEDIVPDRFGPDLPAIREWTEAHYDFSGYVTGFDPAELADRDALRVELGYRPDELVCVVTVGGSGVGEHLLQRVIAAYPEASRLVPGLRMIVVTGPRIDPASLVTPDGLEVRSYVPQLYRHLAACDLAVVQGGLTTCMELTASKRPFLYFPLRHHFEQNFHVRHRLERYGAGHRMDYAKATPDVIAHAMAEEIGREPSYRDVETDGAARAAVLIGDLL